MDSLKKHIIDAAGKIFEQGSITFFNSAQFFPDEVRGDISILYSFVRIPDDLVDSLPQKDIEFSQFKDSFTAALKGHLSDNLIIQSFITLMKEKQIDTKYPLIFLKSMEQDLVKRDYATIEELEEYMVGSAEVVGIMIAKILGLSKESYYYAQMLGKSLQFINFIRDINHDLELNRVYIPAEFIKKYQLPSLTLDDAKNHPTQFSQLIRDLITLYLEWQTEAEIGFKYIPSCYLIPIKTASDIYKWTAMEIYHNPFVIYEKRLKPTPNQILEMISNNKQLLSQS